METFVVRVWSPGADDGPDGMRGTVTHLGSGASIVFTEPDALLRFLTGDGQGTSPATNSLDTKQR
jgi:hypothetical protein